MSNLMKKLTIGSNTYEVCDANAREDLENKVSYNVQSLTADQQAQVRSNIDAVTPAYVDSAKAEAKTYTREQMKKAAHRNLLDNSDFSNPVNQRAKTNYSSPEYSIDRWKIADNDVSNVVIVNDGYVTISATSGMGWVSQYFEENMLKVGKIYTVAVWLLGGNEPKVGSAIIPQIGSDIDINVDSGLQIRLSHNAFEFLLWNGTKDITNVALYEGEYTLDTLPEYQPKGYEQELLICRQYDPSTGEYIGLRKFGQPRNLLDNSDFTNPVNQRGYTTWTPENGTDTTTVKYKFTGGYTIDRWRIQNGNKLTVNTGFVAVTNMDTNSRHYLAQPLPDEKLIGEKTVTVALKMQDGTVHIGSGLVPKDTSAYKDILIFNGNSIRVYPNSVNLMIAVGVTLNIEWIALYEGEYTIDTLPEYQPKGYSAELAECRRYYRRYGGIGNMVIGNAYGNITSRSLFALQNVDMRLTNPTITFTGTMELVQATKAYTVTQVLVNVICNSVAYLSIDSTGLTQGQFYAVRLAGGAYLEILADL